MNLHSKNIFKLLISFGMVFIFSSTLFANELIIFPAKGQSSEQMEKDKYDCYQWAKNESKFDPMAPPTATTAPPPKQQQQGGVVKGAARGALVGLTVGAITNNDKGRSTGAGAAAGGLVGGMRKRDQTNQQKQAEQQWAQKESANYQQNRNRYNRAYAACLTGKGYTVK